MKIGIAAPFNPCALKSYLAEDNRNNLQDINISASSVNNIVKSLIDAGHEVWVFTIGKCSAQFDGDKIHVIIVEGAKWNRYFPDLRKLASKIRDEIERIENDIDVLHAHWCYEYALAVSSFTNRKPVFCTIRDWAPVIYSQISVKKRFKNILFKLYWKYKIIIFREVLTNSSINFIANSEYTAALFKSEYPNRDINIIHNSIEDEIIVDKPINHDNNFISIAMSLEDGRKNIKNLVKAFSVFCETHNDYKLILVGNYHPNGGVYEYAKKLGILGNVVFTGIKNRNEIISLIDSSFCMVHPAFEETFGNIIIEAMARGVVVIGGDNSGAVPYVLGKGQAGILCNVNDWKDIKNKMDFVAKEKKHVEKVVLRALDMVKCFSNTAIAEKHLKEYFLKKVNP